VLSASPSGAAKSAQPAPGGFTLQSSFSAGPVLDKELKMGGRTALKANGESAVHELGVRLLCRGSFPAVLRLHVPLVTSVARSQSPCACEGAAGTCCWCSGWAGSHGCFSLP